jgi:hypothetical protein
MQNRDPSSSSPHQHLHRLLSPCPSPLSTSVPATSRLSTLIPAPPTPVENAANGGGILPDITPIAAASIVSCSCRLIRRDRAGEHILARNNSLPHPHAPPPASLPVQPQAPKKSRRGPRSRSSQYRGVTFYRRTGRWESHIWSVLRPLAFSFLSANNQLPPGSDTIVSLRR